MSGGEPSSIKQCLVCAAVTRSQFPVENRRRNSFLFCPVTLRPALVLSLLRERIKVRFRFCYSGKERIGFVSGALPQVAAPDL